MSLWITNLNSIESMEAKVKEAEAALDASQPGPERRMAARSLEIAKLRLADVKRTFKLIELEHGGKITIKEPHATPQRTSEQIAAQGIVGIYLQGAARSAAQPGVTLVDLSQMTPITIEPDEQIKAAVRAGDAHAQSLGK